MELSCPGNQTSLAAPGPELCVWKSNENFLVSENYVFKCYLWVSETFLRVGPIVTLAILNILIIHKFLKLARR